MPDRLNIDFETRSVLDLKKVGVHRYVEDPSTDIWCMAFAFDDEEVQLWTPGADVRDVGAVAVHVLSGGEIRAWNAEFERTVWTKILGPRYGFPIPKPEQFVDTAAEAAAMTLPRKLEKAAQALRLPVEKDMTGNRLAIQMAKPRRPRKDEDPGALFWWDDEERRQKLYAYCRQDVRVEREVGKHLRHLSSHERRIYLLDQKINDRGVRVDVPLVKAGLALAKQAEKQANKELKEITGGVVTAVTKTADIVAFCGLPDCTKATVRDTLDGVIPLPLDTAQRRVLEIRQDAGKSSAKKLVKILEMVLADGYLRGLLLYHGAGTGRWAGRGVQPQNFPRPAIKDIERFIALVLAKDYAAIEKEEAVLHVLASLLRSTLIASPGHRFLAGDFAQIEARVLAWIACQDDLVDAFAKGAKVYEIQAAYTLSRKLGRPVAPEEVGKDSQERQILGKMTVLGAGFQMGADSYAAQVQAQTGIILPRGARDEKGRLLPGEVDEAKDAIDGYRAKNDRIVQFWWDIERAALDAVRRPGTVTRVGRGGMIRYIQKGMWLWCVLPSGRPLAYAYPKIKMRETWWGEKKLGLQVMAVSSKTRQWGVQHVYGGFLTENVVQAMARDLMASAMLRVEEKGYPVVLTVHDEILADVPEGHGSLEEFEALMKVRPRWAAGLPVAAEAWEGERYRK